MAAQVGVEAAPGSDFISVFARVRPSEHPSPNLEFRDRSLDIVVPHGLGSEGGQAENYSYQYSEVFGPHSSQQQVFDRVARDLVLGALDGVNCTIFAYGQTGSGKTFTMCGGKANYMRDRGIIPRTLGAIFEAIDSRDDDIHYSVSMSMIEIYKEVGKDLLAKGVHSGAKKSAPVTISMVKGDQPVLIGAKRVALASEDDGLQQYCLGEVHRTVAETSHNMVSSRSHCVCTIFIEASDPGAQVVRTSKVQIVDLAGSERLKPYEKGSQEKKGLMNEAVSINLSLHYLSAVITALNSRSKLVPYRNSFLTKLLKDALGGNAKAAMVMTVDPSDASLPETIASCRFAQRVANVKTNARVNEERDPQLLIAELRRRNAELEAAAGGGAGGAANAREDQEVPDDELRRRIRAFLEDDRGASEGGSSLKVGRMPHGAMAAFRIFREIFWADLLHRSDKNGASRAAATDPELPQPELKREDSWLTAAEQFVNEGGGMDTETDPPCKMCGARRKGTHGDGTSPADDSRTLLLECQAECRMLRAALAAQPAPRPTKKASSRPSREAKLQNDLIASQGECKRLRSALAALASSGKVNIAGKANHKPKLKPKIKRAASTDPRPRNSRSSTNSSVGFSQEDMVNPARRSTNSSVGFSPEDVVDRRRSSASVRPASAVTTATLDHSSPPSRASEPVASPKSAWVAADSSSRSAGHTCAAVDAVARASFSPSTTRETDTYNSTSTVTSLRRSTVSSALAEPAPSTVTSSGTSDAWLHATTALTDEELACCGSEPEAYKLFLRRDPRAGDIWQSELQRLSTDMRARMEEAKTCGDKMEQTKEAMTKVQMALDNLKAKLREAEDAASVDASARQKAENLRAVIAKEEPRLEILLREKSDSFQTDRGRLKEIKRELIHIDHAKKTLEMTVKAEFKRWRDAVDQRYPMEVAAATAAVAAEASACADGEADANPESSTIE